MTEEVVAVLELQRQSFIALAALASAGFAREIREQDGDTAVETVLSQRHKSGDEDTIVQVANRARSALNEPCAQPASKRLCC